MSMLSSTTNTMPLPLDTMPAIAVSGQQLRTPFSDHFDLGGGYLGTPGGEPGRPPPPPPGWRAVRAVEAGSVRVRGPPRTWPVRSLVGACGDSSGAVALVSCLHCDLGLCSPPMGMDEPPPADVAGLWSRWVYAVSSHAARHLQRGDQPAPTAAAPAKRPGPRPRQLRHRPRRGRRAPAMYRLSRTTLTRPTPSTRFGR